VYYVVLFKECVVEVVVDVVLVNWVEGWFFDVVRIVV